jgi:hypothetical protein
LVCFGRIRACLEEQLHQRRVPTVARHDERAQRFVALQRSRSVRAYRTHKWT